MSKKIYMSEADIAKFEAAARKKIAQQVEEIKKKKLKMFSESGISVEFKPDDDQLKSEKAFLQFSSDAWLKILNLVNSFSTEVQWHGLVRRKNKNTFLVYDIATFPHTATSATVVSDQEKYENWSLSLPDEVRNKMRCHGHSHVYMGVTPSSVDNDYRESVIKNLGRPDENTDLFYVFFIANKRGELSAEIFDIQNNIRYLSSDITYDVIFADGTSLFTFEDEAKRIVVAPEPPVIKYNAPNTKDIKKKEYTSFDKYQRQYYDDRNYYDRNY